jgi:hypothetical protein
MTLHHGSHWPQSRNVRGLNKFLTKVVLAITWGFPSRYFPTTQFPYGNPPYRWQCPADCMEPAPPGISKRKCKNAKALTLPQTLTMLSRSVHLLAELAPQGLRGMPCNGRSWEVFLSAQEIAEKLHEQRKGYCSRMCHLCAKRRAGSSHPRQSRG